MFDDRSWKALALPCDPPDDDDDDWDPCPPVPEKPERPARQRIAEAVFIAGMSAVVAGVVDMAFDELKTWWRGKKADE